MEFDEMKKIWDAQNGQLLYAIDEEALHKRVLVRKDKAARVANRGERVMIGALIFSTSIIMGAATYKSKFELFPVTLAVLMAVVALVIYIRRRKRLAWQNSFDNTMLGDMNQAVANAAYQVKLSEFGKWLYIAVAVLSVAGIIDTVAEWWKGALVAVFFIAGYFAARWEHKALYVSQKRKLETMRDKLISLEEEHAQSGDYEDMI